MQYSLEYLEQNYDRVIIQLKNKRICGVKRAIDGKYVVCSNDYWDSYDGKTGGEVELRKAYNKETILTEYHIDKYYVVNTNKNFVDFVVRTQTATFNWDYDSNNPHNLKFKKGDVVKICKSESRIYYDQMRGRIGTIVDAEYKQYVDDERITYRVRVDGHYNEYQDKGLWVFHDENSLELYNTQNDDQKDTYEYWLSARTMGRQHYLINKNYGITHASEFCEPTAYQLYKPSNIGNVWDYKLNDYARYIDDYVARAVVDQPTEEIKTFDIKGETYNMDNIVEIYKDRKYAKIDKKYKELRDGVKNTDARYKTFKECVDTLDRLYKEDKVVTPCYTDIQLSEETIKKLIQLDECRREEVEKLHKLIYEVLAQLQMCETYDQKMNILKTYKIVKENGKVNA